VNRWGFGLWVTLLAAAVRLCGLGVQSLWLDEAFSHLFATLPLDMVWQAMIVDAVHPPLYYLLMRLVIVLVGGSEFALRFPSALAGVLTVALLYRAGLEFILAERFAPVTPEDLRTLEELRDHHLALVEDFGSAYELYRLEEVSNEPQPKPKP